VLCQERERLFADYREAVTLWVASVNILADQSDLSDQNLTSRIEEKRFNALIAKDLYENHIAAHDC
jgi:hypothetical protein